MRVYVIEDDPITSLIIKRSLSKLELFNQIQTFEEGTDALAQLETTTEHPNVILMDLNMPIMDGWTFLEAMKQNPDLREIPVIIMSSSIDPADIARSKTYSNVKGFFDKPISKELIHYLQGMLCH